MRITYYSCFVFLFFFNYLWQTPRLTQQTQFCGFALVSASCCCAVWTKPEHTAPPRCVLAAEKQSDNKHTHILLMKTWRSQQTASISYFMTAPGSGCGSVFCRSAAVSIIRDTRTSFSSILCLLIHVYIYIIWGDVRWLTETSQFWGVFFVWWVCLFFYLFIFCYFVSWEIWVVAWIHYLMFFTQQSTARVCLWLVHLFRTPGKSHWREKGGR